MPYSINLIPFHSASQKLSCPLGHWIPLTVYLSSSSVQLLFQNTRSSFKERAHFSFEFFELPMTKEASIISYLRELRMWSDAENAVSYHSLLFNSHFPSGLLHYFKLNINGTQAGNMLLTDHLGVSFSIEGSDVNQAIQDLPPLSSFEFEMSRSCLSTCDGCGAHILECKECRGELVHGICYKEVLSTPEEVIAGLTSVHVLNLLNEIDLIRQELRQFDSAYAFALEEVKWTLQTNTLQQDVFVSQEYAQFIVPLDFASSDTLPVNLQISVPERVPLQPRNMVFTIQTKSGVRLSAQEIALGVAVLLPQKSSSSTHCECSVMGVCHFQECICNAHFEGHKCEYLKYAKSSISNLILQHLRWKRIILPSLQPQQQLHNLALLSTEGHFFSPDSLDLILQLVFTLNTRSFVHHISRQHSLHILSNLMLYCSDAQRLSLFQILGSIVTSHMEAQSTLDSYTSDRILVQVQSLSEGNTLSVPSEPTIGLFLPVSEIITSLALISYSAPIFGYECKDKIISLPLSFFAFDAHAAQITSLSHMCYVNLKYDLPAHKKKLQGSSDDIEESIVRSYNKQLACGIWNYRDDSFQPCSLVKFYPSYVTCGCLTTGHVVLYVSDEPFVEKRESYDQSVMISLLIIGLFQGVLVFLNLSFWLRDSLKWRNLPDQLHHYLNPMNNCPDLEEEEPERNQQKEIQLDPQSNRDTLSSPNQLVEGSARGMRRAKRVVHNFRVELSLVELRRQFFLKSAPRPKHRCQQCFVLFRFSLQFTNPVWNLGIAANPILPKTTQLTFVLFGVSWELVLSFLFLAYNLEQIQGQLSQAAIAVSSIGVLMLPCFLIGKFLSLSRQNLRKIVMQDSAKEMEQCYLKQSHRMKLIAATVLMAVISTALNGLLLLEILSTHSLATNEWYKCALWILLLDFVALELLQAALVSGLRGCGCGGRVARVIETYRFYRNVIT